MFDSTECVATKVFSKYSLRQNSVPRLMIGKRLGPQFVTKISHIWHEIAFLGQATLNIYIFGLFVITNVVLIILVQC